MACQAAPATLKSAFLEPVRAVGGCLRVGAACSSCAAAILVTSRISPLHPSALPLLLLHPRPTPAWCIPTPSVQVAAQLSAELAVEMCGRKDEDFMGLFTGRTSSLARGLFCAAAAAAISALIWAWRDAAGARQRPQPPAPPGRSALPPSQPASRPPPPCAAAAGVLSALEASRDALAKRVEGLVHCKNEFQARRRGRPWVGDGLLGQGQHR